MSVSCLLRWHIRKKCSYKRLSLVERSLYVHLSCRTFNVASITVSMDVEVSTSQKVARQCLLGAVHAVTQLEHTFYYHPFNIMARTSKVLAIRQFVLMFLCTPVHLI